MREAILFKLVFVLIKMLPVEALIAILKKYCGQMADWIIAKAEQSGNKIDDAIINFFRDVFQHLDLLALEQLADTVMDIVEEQGNDFAVGICKAIRYLFGVEDNDAVAVSMNKVRELLPSVREDR